MINKIDRLVSIGKFRNYQAAGQVNFKKLTLIYGDNGGGKTTLTSVLRSLTSNKPGIVRSRISTNHTAPQAAQITQTGTPNIFHTFGTGGWTTPFLDIEIFDIHFVNDNIYSGFDFNDEHKKQLHQFVIGAQGIAIQNQIEQNKASKTASRQTQSNIELQLIQQVGNGLTSNLISSFLSLPSSQASGITQRIASAEAALASANANSVIRTLPRLSSLSLINSGINFPSLITDLQTTSQSIQNEALQNVFSNHCRDLAANSLQGPEGWLLKGFEYLKRKRATDSPIISCPFCKQTIDASAEILTAYTSQFNTEFNAMVQRLQAHLRSLQNFNLEASIQAINNVNQINTERIASWTVHLPNTVQAPICNIIADNDVLRAELQSVIALVQQKLTNPTMSVAASAAEILQATGQAVNTRINGYNQSVTAYNSSTAAFLSGIQTVANAQIEVETLRRTKIRFEPPIVVLCDQLIAEKQSLQALENAYTTLSQQQQAAATAFFSSYQTRINHYLGSVFRTHFRIDNVVHVAPQGRAMQSKISYNLTIDGQAIAFDPNQPFNAKHCLSEGDKSTIALAFFLSKLDIAPNRQDKILVFDDPLSSLDTNRRTYTTAIIKALVQQMKQVVVLSHNEYFLHEIGKDFAVADKCTLRITENFAAKASIIEVCDLNDLVKNDYFKHIEALELFRTNPNHAIKDTVFGWLRNVLEAHLRFKFYKEIRLMQGQKTFGRLVSFLDTSGVIFRNNANRATILNTLNLINSVSWMPHHGTPMPNYTALGINPNTITAPELDNLIQDTLDLIEVQL